MSSCLLVKPPAGGDLFLFKLFWTYAIHIHAMAMREKHPIMPKQTLWKDFLRFVDANCQPNGRSADSSGPTFYFFSKFKTIQAPKPNAPNYKERVKHSGNLIVLRKKEGEVGAPMAHRITG